MRSLASELVIKAVRAGAAHPRTAWLLQFFRSGTTSSSLPSAIAGVGAGGEVVPHPALPGHIGSAPTRPPARLAGALGPPVWQGASPIRPLRVQPVSTALRSLVSVSCSHGSHCGAAGADSSLCPLAWLPLFPLSTLGKLRHAWLDGHRASMARPLAERCWWGGQPGPPPPAQLVAARARDMALEGQRAAVLRQGISNVLAASLGLFLA